MSNALSQVLREGKDNEAEKWKAGLLEKRTSPSTWTYVEKLLHALHVTAVGNAFEFEFPELSVCADGSADLHWDSDYEILLNVREEGVSFYGDAKGNPALSKIKGSFEGNPDPSVFLWMLWWMRDTRKALKLGLKPVEEQDEDPPVEEPTREATLQGVQRYISHFEEYGCEHGEDWIFPFLQLPDAEDQFRVFFSDARSRVTLLKLLVHALRMGTPLPDWTYPFLREALTSGDCAEQDVAVDVFIELPSKVALPLLREALDIVEPNWLKRYIRNAIDEHSKRA